MGYVVYESGMETSKTILFMIEKTASNVSYVKKLQGDGNVPAETNKLTNIHRILQNNHIYTNIHKERHQIHL